MDYPPAISQWLVALLGAIVMASLCLYGFLFKSALREGKVKVENFGLPDLMAGTVFFSWMGGSALRSFSSPDREVNLKALLDGAVLYFIIVLVIAGFFKLRKISSLELFGLRRVPPGKVMLLAIGLLAGIFPAIAVTGVISQRFFGPEAQPQEVVKFFQNSVQLGDTRSMLATILIGGILAPIAEELMFRGYLYGICKRFVGSIAGIAVNSLLFAAVHSNLMAFPSLCVLAIALTVAYEISGSLLVPIAMHAGFNLTMFFVMIKVPTS